MGKRHRLCVARLAFVTAVLKAPTPTRDPTSPAATSWSSSPPSAADPPRSPPAPPACYTRPHKLGDVYQEVASIAKRLGVPLRVTIDADLDKRVRYVQSKHDLPFDGIVGPDTAKALG